MWKSVTADAEASRVIDVAPPACAVFERIVCNPVSAAKVARSKAPSAILAAVKASEAMLAAVMTLAARPLTVVTAVAVPTTVPDSV